MSKRQALASFAIAVLALAMAQRPAEADSSQSKASQSLPKDAPFGHARGLFPPLWFSIDGLYSGVAKVGAGARRFGVCWQGGAAPYEVRLAGPGGEQVFDRRAISGTRLLLGPDELRLDPGAYVLTVTDDTGVAKSGRFLVVEASGLPPVPGGAGRELARARQLAGMADYAYAFEAYLTLAPLLDHPSPDAQALADRLCHSGS